MTKTKILVVDDEKLIAWSLQKDFAREGYEVRACQSGKESLRLFEEFEPDAVLLDIQLGDADGKDILQQLKKKNARAAVIMITANDEIKTAVHCMREGAFSYINKPFEFDEIKLTVEKAVESLQLKKKVEALTEKEKNRYDLSSIVAESAQMKKVLSLVNQIAQSDASTVLLQGESGTGKDLIARAIHYTGKRSQNSFVSINCAAIPDNLLESELFGHQKGAFTDARQKKKGLVEEADGGTLFLDEIGDMSKGLQAKLLHLIDQKKFRRVGDVQEQLCDIRIIAATNKDLKKEVQEGRFREDLYFRLNVVPVMIPPLRERKEDIAPLVSFFMNQFNREFNKSITKIDEICIHILSRYDWPGNVRELKNVIERTMILNQGTSVTSSQLPAEIDCHCSMKEAFAPSPSSGQERPVNQLSACLIGIPLDEIEKQVVAQALKAADGNQSEAARILKIGRDALRYKMQKFGLDQGATD